MYWPNGKRRKAVPRLQKKTISIVYIIYMDPGEKMQNILRAGGSLKDIELQVKKWSTQTSATGDKGQWVTQKFLKDEKHYDQLLVCIFSCLNMQIHTWILVCLSFKGDDRQQLGLGESKQQASHKPCAQEGRSTSSTWRLVWKQERTGWKHNHGRRSQFGGLVYIEVD